MWACLLAEVRLRLLSLTHPDKFQNPDATRIFRSEELYPSLLGLVYSPPQSWQLL